MNPPEDKPEEDPPKCPSSNENTNLPISPSDRMVASATIPQPSSNFSVPGNFVSPSAVPHHGSMMPPEVVPSGGNLYNFDGPNNHPPAPVQSVAATPQVATTSPQKSHFPPRNPPGTKRPAPAPERQTRLPVSRIKTMMKFDPDVNIIAQEAAYLVAKASEQFIEVLAKACYANTLVEKRKTMKLKDCEQAIVDNARLCFLDGIDLV